MTVSSANLPELLRAATELRTAGTDVGGLADGLGDLDTNDPSQTGPALDRLAHQWSTGLGRVETGLTALAGVATATAALFALADGRR